MIDPGIVRDLSDFGWLPPAADRMALPEADVARAEAAYADHFGLATPEELLAHLARRFCRNPDPGAPHGPEAAKVCRWPHSPVRVERPAWSIGALSAQAVQAAFAWSLDRWQSECGFRWAWNAGASPPNIRAEAKRIDGNAGTLAWSYLPCGMGESDTALQRYDLDDAVLVRNAEFFRVVVLHELGHALGLEHSNDPKACMYPAARDDVLDLGGDDLPRIRALYPGAGAKPPSAPPPGPGPAPPDLGPGVGRLDVIHRSIGIKDGREGRFWFLFEHF